MGRTNSELAHKIIKCMGAMIINNSYDWATDDTCDFVQTCLEELEVPKSDWYTRDESEYSDFYLKVENLAIAMGELHRQLL